MSYLKQYFGDDYGFDRYFTYNLNKDGTELFLYSTARGLTEVMTCNNGKITGPGYEHIYGIKKSKKDSDHKRPELMFKLAEYLRGRSDQQDTEYWGGGKNTRRQKRPGTK